MHGLTAAYRLRPLDRMLGLTTMLNTPDGRYTRSLKTNNTVNVPSRKDR
jgi:hypothetical protein